MEDYLNIIVNGRQTYKEMKNYATKNSCGTAPGEYNFYSFDYNTTHNP